MHWAIDYIIYLGLKTCCWNLNLEVLKLYGKIYGTVRIQEFDYRWRFQLYHFCWSNSPHIIEVNWVTEIVKEIYTDRLTYGQTDGQTEQIYTNNRISSVDSVDSGNLNGSHLVFGFEIFSCIIHVYNTKSHWPEQIFCLLPSRVPVSFL